MSKKIITLGELRKLVNENKTHLIRMDVYSYGQFDYTSEKITNVKIDDYYGFSMVNWGSDLGEPCVELQHETDKFDKLYDSSSSDYRYTLFIKI